MNSKEVRIVDGQGHTLFKCSSEEIEKAYEYALRMEKLGIEVSLHSPSSPEVLASSLGIGKRGLKLLRNDLQEEINSHS